jgi:prevent-host-death family protein
MIEVTVEEAQIRLDELITRAVEGEEVFITQDGHRLVQLVPISQAEYQALLESTKKPLTASDDLNASLETAKKGLENDPILSVLGSLSFEPLTNEEIDEELYGPYYGK